MKQLFLIIFLILVGLNGHAAGADAAASADQDRVIPPGCSDFTAEQLQDKDACFAMIKPDLDPKASEAVYFDPNLMQSTDECGGCHFKRDFNLTDNTNKNIYNVPFLKNAVPQISGGSNSGGDETGDGTAPGATE